MHEKSEHKQRMKLPDRDFQLIGDWRNVESEFSLLIKTNEINLCQVRDLQKPPYYLNLQKYI